MTDFYGADVDALRTLAQRFSQAADSLESSLQGVDRTISNSMRWVGPDSNAFRTAWSGAGKSKMVSAVSSLRDGARALEGNARGQETTSAADGASAGGFVGGGGGGGFPTNIGTGTLPSSSNYNSPDIRLRDTNDLAGGMSGAETATLFLNGTYADTHDEAGIITITNADGSKSHIVMIPGTQDWENNEPDSVFSVVVAGQAGLGQNTVLEERIIQMMREHGIKPPDTVQLMGHSLGGLTASNMAADPRLVKEFNVTSVVVVGAYMPDPAVPGVETLRVIDPRDPLVGLGIASLAQGVPTKTVVVDNEVFDFMGGVTSSPLAALSPGVAVVSTLLGANAGGLNPQEIFAQHHVMPAYASSMLTAAQVEGGVLQDWNQSHPEFITQEGGTTTLSTYQVRDNPPASGSNGDGASGGGGGGGAGGTW